MCAADKDYHRTDLDPQKY